jgi:hypothetical protein
MDREGTGVRAACHVLLLPSLCVTCQENTRRAVGEEDGYRVIVGLGEQLAWRWGDDVGSSPSAPRCGQRLLSPYCYPYPLSCVRTSGATLQVP